MFCFFFFSVGIAIIDLFSFHGPRQMLRALQLNTHQVSQVLIANGHIVDDTWEVQQAYKLHSDWLKSAATNQTTLKHLEILAGKAAKQYILALTSMSGRVIASLSNYDLHAMISGIVVLMQTLYWIVYGLFHPLLHQKATGSGQSQSVTSVFIVSGAVLLVAVLHMCVCSSQRLGTMHKYVIKPMPQGGGGGEIGDPDKLTERGISFLGCTQGRTFLLKIVIIGPAISHSLVFRVAGLGFQIPMILCMFFWGGMAQLKHHYLYRSLE